MPLEIREKDEMIENIIDSINERIGFEIDLSEGEPLRTIIEAIVLELDFQYWQLEQAYNSSFIDSATGDELTELVKILGIDRKKAVPSKGTVTFFRETPAILNYFIPEGTIVETIPNMDGEIIQFKTTRDASILIGEKDVNVPIECLIPGSAGNILSRKINKIIDPPEGIEEVVNKEAIVGGEDEESDEDLVIRAKGALHLIGRGTIDAIKNAISNISGIRDVSIKDMARGVGTVDVLILGDLVPLPEEKIKEVNNVICDIKSAGIDVKIVFPNVKNVDISVEIIANERNTIDRNKIYSTIENFVDNLGIGEDLILNQLKKSILLVSDEILDIKVSNPSDNIVSNVEEVIRVGNISITGV